ncbi:MAG TPA: hypothetical protein PKD85_23865, partial [Saprospiraceae bacterium]|nr:hypothetical protein [Saprospiraceae bacterium]
MFIGGLTARAMKIKNDIQGLYHCEVIEVYPKAVTHKLLDENFKSLYKQKGQGTIENFAVLLYELHQIKTSNNPTNWHQLDAVLAWYSTYRYHIRQHLSFGDASGMIIV